MLFHTSAASSKKNSKSRKLSRKQLHSRTMLLDQLESRLLMSASNNGYALTTLANLGSGGSDPKHITGALAMDSNGNLYATTLNGGANGDGAIIEIPSGGGDPITLASFNGANGEEPYYSGLVIDSQGNLYGTTDSGGADGNGVVFEIPATNQSTIAVLGSLAGGLEQGYTVTVDSIGDVFGETFDGGANGTGSIWEIPAGQSNVADVGGANSTTIASFAPLTLGDNETGAFPDPKSSMLLNNDVLFGTTTSGGSDGDGDVFSLNVSGGVILDLGDFTQGSDSQGGLVMDTGGDIFGTSNQDGAHDDGYVFELPSRAENIVDVADFTNSSGSGDAPVGALYLDQNGNLFGGTYDGGVGSDGTVFEMPTTGPSADEVFLLVNFNGATDVSTGVIADGNGDLFAGSFQGGENVAGSVFELTPVHLVVSDVPSLFSDSPDTITPVVTLEGPTGNTITNDDSLVTLGINNGGELSFDTAMSVDGVATFTDLAVTTPGPSFVINATDANGDQLGISEPFAVAPQPDDTSTHLVFLTQPVYNDGEVPIVTVGIENSAGHIVTDDDSLVTLSELGLVGDLGGTLTVQAHDGIATFTDLTVDDADVYTLVANDDDLTGADSAPFTVVAVPTSLRITSDPEFIAGVGVSSITVQLLDQFNDPIHSGSSAVQLSLTSGTGKPISLGTANMVKGLATFRNVKIKTAGEFELGASSKGVQAYFEEVEVFPASPAKLAFVNVPPNVKAASPFSVEVEILDRFGNVDTLDNSSITLTLTGTSGAVLGGTKTVAVSDGMADFGPLTVSKAGTYKLVATDSHLGSGKSISTKSFTVGA